MKEDWTNVATNFTQKGYHYILGTNSHANGRITGHNPVDMIRKVKGAGKVKVKIVLKKGSEAETVIETDIYTLTVTEGDFKYTIPTNPGGTERSVKAYIVTVGGEGEREELIFSGTQFGEFYYGYIPSSIPSSGSSFGHAYIDLYGHAADDDNSTITVVAVPDNGGWSQTNSYKVKNLAHYPEFYLPSNTSGKDIVWTLNFQGNPYSKIKTHTQQK